MAKKKANKKGARKSQKAEPQAPQDQDQPQARRVADLPRMSNLRLSQLPGPLSFRLAGGLLKDDE